MYCKIFISGVNIYQTSPLRRSHCLITRQFDKRNVKKYMTVEKLRLCRKCMYNSENLLLCFNKMLICRNESSSSTLSVQSMQGTPTRMTHNRHTPGANTSEETVIHKLETLIAIQKENTNRIDELCGLTQQNILKNVGPVFPPNFPQFPIDEKKVFQQLEQDLEEQEKFNYLVSWLAMLTI